MSKKVRKRKITLEQLMNEYKIFNHIEIVKKVNELIKDNKLKPILNSEETPNYPRIKTNYWWIEEIEEISNIEEILKEIKFKLHPSIEIDYYRENVKKYIEDRELILKINEYISNDKDDIIISVNERSYQIFYDEKELRSNNMKRILKNLNIDIEKDLNTYYTPEPFFYYSRDFSKGQNVLIVENKDTFVTLKRLMIEGYSKFLGVEIGTIIYGEGYKIISSFEDINYNDTISYLNDENNTYLYWGDIDKEGISIYVELKETYIDKNIRLFIEAYDYMVNKYLSLRNDFIPTKNKQKRMKQNESLVEELKNLKIDILSEIIEKNCYIPQEIVTNKDLSQYTI